VHESPNLVKRCGYAVRTFAAAGGFLAADAVEQTRCLILDVAIPGMTGPQPQQALTRWADNPDQLSRSRRCVNIRLTLGAVDC
jgi:FixJ family two-component response regulator